MFAAVRFRLDDHDARPPAHRLRRRGERRFRRTRLRSTAARWWSEPNPTVGSNSDQGTAYVFAEPGSGWADMTQTAELTASDGAADSFFG